MRDELSLLPEGCIVRGNRAIISNDLRRQVLNLKHEGHPGIVKMEVKCRECVWWPGIDLEIEQCVRECTDCTISGKPVKPMTPPIKTAEACGPWQKLSIDIFGEVKAAPSHQKFVITFINLYSHYRITELALCGTVTSNSVSGIFL